MSVAVNIWIKLFPVHVTGNGAQSKKARRSDSRISIVCAEMFLWTEVEVAEFTSEYILAGNKVRLHYEHFITIITFN